MGWVTLELAFRVELGLAQILMCYQLYKNWIYLVKNMLILFSHILLFLNTIKSTKDVELIPKNYQQWQVI